VPTRRFEIGGPVRYILELKQQDGSVLGTVLPEGATDPVEFHGWLELLRMLETDPATAHPE
jgi:hypothetical protein